MRLDVLAQVTSQMLERPMRVSQVLAAGDISAVVRLVGEQPSDSVVVKYQAGGAAFASSERSALRLLSLQGLAVVPKVYVAGVNLVVMEDLTAADRVEELLAGFDRAVAERALRGTAAAVAKIHVAGARVVHRYAKARHAPPRAPVEASQLLVLGERVSVITEMLGLSVPSGLAGLLKEESEALAAPGDLATITHGDVRPGNTLLAERGVVLVDFEKSGVRSPMYDVVSWRLGMPVPGPLLVEMDESWRAGVAERWPELGTQEGFDEALRPYESFRGLMSFVGMTTSLLEADLELAEGVSGRAVLLDVLAKIGRREDALGELGRAAFEGLDVRWPEAVMSWPAFGGR